MPIRYRLSYAGDTREQTDGNMRDSLGNETFRLWVHECANYVFGVAEVGRPRFLEGARVCDSRLPAQLRWMKSSAWSDLWRLGARSVSSREEPR